MTTELVWMTAGDARLVADAGELFDGQPQDEWTDRFLRQPNHHLCIAYVDGDPAGFVTGVEITHPDKGTEMLLYELGVGEAYRGRGLGRALTTALRTLGHERGCTGMWVPTDDDNDAALATYRALEPDEEAASLIIWWDLSEG